jgi:hypothetical protein
MKKPRLGQAGFFVVDNGLLMECIVERVAEEAKSRLEKSAHSGL